MKTEFLKELGLEKEVIEKIMAENGKDINREKESFKEISEKYKAITDDKAKMEQKLEELSNTKSTADEYKTKLEELQEQIAKEKELTEAQKADEALNSKILSFAGDKKFTNNFVKKALLDEVKTKFKEDNTQGLEKIFTELTKDQAGVFQSEVQDEDMAGVDSSVITKSTALDSMRAAMGLSIDKK